MLNPPQTPKSLSSLVTSLFPDLEPKKPIKVSRAGGSAPRTGPSPAANATTLLNPCLGCPRARAPKVKPVIPTAPKLIVIGMAPGEREEKVGQPFQGPSGDQIRRELQRCGFNLKDVGFANLARCRPENDDFSTKDWQMAETRCFNYLRKELAANQNVPLLLLGSRPATKLSGEGMSVTAYRGLWIKTVTGHQAYVARHPSGILRVKESGPQKALFEEWHGDLHRMADRVRGVEKERKVDVLIFKSPADADVLLKRLAAHQHPWAFDIETYDALEFPSRRWVSTDPCHEDFRVRGVALAWGPDKGAWIEFGDTNPDDARPFLDQAFMSATEKWAFNGGFDEEGLTYNGWVTEVVNRRGDGMLEMVALSDGRHASLRLERAVVDQLGYPQYWNGVDKSRMRDILLVEVARAAVEDACATWALCARLHKRLEKGEYFTWPTWTQR